MNLPPAPSTFEPSRRARWSAAAGRPAGLTAASVALALAATMPARASEACPDLTLELGVVTALPALLDVGQSLGGMAAFTAGYGPLVYGVRASVSDALEYSPSWRIDHTETRLRGLVGVRAAAGRGTWVLRLGLGLTVVHEARERHDASSLALTEAPEESAWAAVPAIDLEGGLVLAVFGDWGLALFAGPTLHFGEVSDGARWGWTGSGAIVWTP